jgi:hypothetical protein
MIQSLLSFGFILYIVSAHINLSSYVKSTCKGFLGPVVLLSSVLPKSASAEVTLAPWDNNVRIEVIQSTKSGTTPKAGDLVAVRFKGSYKDREFDNTISTSEPYYFRYHPSSSTISHIS